MDVSICEEERKEREVSMGAGILLSLLLQLTRHHYVPSCDGSEDKKLSQ